MLKLFVDINSWVKQEGENACDEGMLVQRFEAYWPKLNPKLETIRVEPVVGPVPEERTVDDKVDEILRIVPPARNQYKPVIVVKPPMVFVT